MKIDLQIKGLDRVQEQLRKLSGDAVRTAYATAVTDTAYQAQRAIQKNMRTQFDRPTAYLTKSVLVEHATPENLSARVAPTRIDQTGVDPQKILHAQEFGGVRRAKRYESALRAIGVLPGGHLTAIPKNPFPGSSDGRGNLNGRFVIKLLNYFQANKGAVAAMSKRRQMTLNKSISHGSVFVRTKRGLMEREVRLLDGFAMFVSDGTKNLAPGIWARRLDGRTVMPVVLFIRHAAYGPRLGVGEIVKRGELQDYFERRLRYRIRKAVDA